MALFEDVRRKVLSNGMEILVREDHSSPVVALNFFVRVGSLNEDETTAGWSHGIEHMLFKGTHRRGPGDIAREISNAGGETNAGTGYESTNYYIVVPAHNFETALDIHADVLQHSTFDEHELEKERHVLIKENEMYRDRPSGFGFTWEDLLAEGFTTHRYQRPIGGPDENLLRAGRDEILIYKNTYYVPGNLSYVVVGDVKAEDVFRVMEDKFGAWPAVEVKADQSPAEPRQTGLRYRETTGDVEKAYVKLGFHIPPELTDDTDAILVLAHVLGSGRSGRLYERVREEQGLILGSGIMDATGNDPGYLVVEFTAEPEKAAAALPAVVGEILAFQEHEVTPEELERTLRAVRNETLYTLETMEGQAGMLGHYALLGDYRLAGSYLERMTRVTAADIRRVAKQYLNLSQATVYAHRPVESKPFAESPAKLAAWLNKEAVAGSPATPGTTPRHTAALPPSRTGSRGEPEVVQLAGGTRVILQPDGRLPLVSLAAYLPMGSGVEDHRQAGITRLTQSSLLKGAGGMSAAEIAQTMELLGIRLRPFSSRDVSGVSLAAVTSDLDPAMDLFEKVVVQPDFPTAAVHRERERALVEIASLRDDTMQFTLAEFYRRIFPEHPYGRLVSGTEASVSSFEPEDLRAWHRRFYRAADLVVSVVGDYDRNAMLKRLEGMFAGLDAGGAPPVIPPVAAPTAASRTELTKQVSQAVVVLGYPGVTIDSGDRYALDVWTAYLSGMGNRLFTRLRDELHLCYFTGAFVSSFLRGGAIGGYVGTGPDQVEEATAELVRELERSTQSPPTPEELTRAKNNIAGSYLIDMQTRMSWAGTYARDEVMGLGYAEALRYPKEIAAITGEQVQAVAKRYLDPSRLTVTLLRPEAEADAAPKEAAVEV